jgi:hypothetical protein
LCDRRRGLSSAPVNRRFVILTVLMLVLALTRIPGLAPWNFSAVYAIAFCAGAYFRGRGQWLLPLGVLLGTDLLLSAYHEGQVEGSDYFTAAALLYLLGNYAGYAVLFGLGRWLGEGRRRPLGLIGGGVLGALAFYLITNTLSWLFNPFRQPEYTRDLAGWIIALTKGAGGYPETWTFFRNTLFSGGLFTALFVAAAEATTEPESKAETEAQPEADADVPGQPEPEKSA